MLSLFGFGKKRKSPSKKSSKKKGSKKGNAKPPAKVLKMCKKLKVKVIIKRGSKRSYKKVSVLMKQCRRKLKMLKKLKKKMPKKSSKKAGSRRKGFRRSYKKKRSSFGSFRFGSSCDAEKMMFGARRIRFGGSSAGMGMEFGKRRKAPKQKVTKASAMKAFKEFYRRHCSPSLEFGRSRFGNGGNPALRESMGYEFCPLGSGGVLGANSTGLFPSPCTSRNMGQVRREDSVMLPKRYGGSDKKPSSAIGARHRRASRPSEFGKRRRKM